MVNHAEHLRAMLLLGLKYTSLFSQSQSVELETARLSQRPSAPERFRCEQNISNSRDNRQWTSANKRSKRPYRKFGAIPHCSLVRIASTKRPTVFKFYSVQLIQQVDGFSLRRRSPVTASDAIRETPYVRRRAPLRRRLSAAAAAAAVHKATVAGGARIESWYVQHEDTLLAAEDRYRMHTRIWGLRWESTAAIRRDRRRGKLEIQLRVRCS
jgi:hypothetical protein